MQIILLPFSWLYGLITDCRNYLYECGFWKINTFKIPIINVGNLTVGGTGKTPHVEYLIRLLKDKYSIVTLSRGYGRKTKGFIIASASASAQSIGDEPFQFYQKYGNDITVTVGENRVEALQKIFSQKPNTDLVILDDAFQHRPVKPSLNLLLMDYNRPINEDFAFPAGRLRERRQGAKRADVVIVTKCPDVLSEENQKAIKGNLESYLKENTPFFFTKVLYGKPKNCRSETDKFKFEKVLLVSGIANPQPFEEYAKKQFDVSEHLIFKDHHDFVEQDLFTIVSAMESTQSIILMTEKDMVKFKPFLNHELLRNISLYYLPIEIGFLEENVRNDFDRLIFSQFDKSFFNT
jgi:tetraacyldisaccharide 4'-kinase